MSDQPEIGYEAARDELIGIVQRLETGGTTLEESLALWERGEQLAKICSTWLDGARERLDAARQAGQSGQSGQASQSGQEAGAATSEDA